MIFFGSTESSLLLCELLSSCSAPASRVADHRLWGTWTSVVAAHRLQNVGSVVSVHESVALLECGVFLDQESDPRPRIGVQILNHWTTREVP